MNKHTMIPTAIVALAFGAAGCSFSASTGGASLNQADVESQVSSGLEESVGVAPSSVDCEGISDIDVEEGNTFSCEGIAPNGDPFEIVVTLTNDEGGFTAVVPG